MKIMIVDDELVSRRKMAKILEDWGIVQEFEGGEAALIAFEKALKESQPFHLITLDLSMPKMDGLEVLSRIRQIEESFYVPTEKQAKVVMVTSNDERDAILAAVSERCTDYVVKPFNKEFIIERFYKVGIFSDDKSTF